MLLCFTVYTFYLVSLFETHDLLEQCVCNFFSYIAPGCPLQTVVHLKTFQLHHLLAKFVTNFANWWERIP